MASGLLSNMAWSNCMISAGLVPCLFPIAVFHCLATENRTRHRPCPFPSRPESENAQESGRYPDNAAAEGFFGRTRQEFFHKRSFAGVTMDEIINMLDDYMVWYRDKRIKTEFGMSIMDRRRGLGLVA